MNERQREGEIGREQCKSRVIDVMHIQFFSIQKRQKREERIKEEEEWCIYEKLLLHVSNTFPSHPK